MYISRSKREIKKSSAVSGYRFTKKKNPGTNGETFTLRKISDSIAVEKIMPIFSPSIDKIELVRKGKVRRARIFYLRDRKGKSAKIKRDYNYNLIC